jgi:hypothetical protein
MATPTPSELADQLDQFLDDYEEEQGFGRRGPHFVRAEQILASPIVGRLPPRQQFTALQLYYCCQFHVLAHMRHAGAENELLLRTQQDPSLWKKARVQARAAATRQAAIVSSRNAWETLMLLPTSSAPGGSSTASHLS